MFVLPASELFRTVSAKMVPRGEREAKPLYLVERTATSRNGCVIVKWVTKKPDGQKLIVKTIRYRHGRFEALRIDNRWDRSRGSVKVTGGKYEMSFARDGHTDTDEGTMEETLLVRDQIIPFMRRHWAKVMRGETVPYRLFVPDRLRTIGFEFYKKRETVVRARPAIVIRMKPSSLILFALVGSIDFTFAAEGDHSMIEQDARVKVKKDGDWIDVGRPGRFSTTLPQSPLSYDGAIVRIRWCVRVRVFLYRGGALLGQKAFRLGDVSRVKVSAL